MIAVITVVLHGAGAVLFAYIASLRMAAAVNAFVSLPSERARSPIVDALVAGCALLAAIGQGVLASFG